METSAEIQKRPSPVVDPGFSRRGRGVGGTDPLV